MKKIVKRCVGIISSLSYAVIELHTHLSYRSQFKKYIIRNGFSLDKVKDEDIYIEQWKGISKLVEPYSYRYFRHYLDSPKDIVPEAVGRCIIERSLNNYKYTEAYADKNLFPEIVGRANVPRTIAARIMGGVIMDGDFKPLRNLNSLNCEALILKPSTNGSSGIGVKKFTYRDGVYKSVDTNDVLDDKLLQDFGDNFVLQAAIEQSDFMNRLCKTSVNTIRVATYRSVKTERVHVLAAIVRVGKDGSYVDNAHAGGMFVGVNVTTGILAKRLYTQYGDESKQWNGVDYEKSEMQIPNWDKVIEFAEMVGRRLRHHRLVALDIALDSQQHPVLIEYNLRSYSYWLFMYTGQKPLGEYTDEIVEFCKKKKQKTIWF